MAGVPTSSWKRLDCRRPLLQLLKKWPLPDALSTLATPRNPSPMKRDSSCRKNSMCSELEMPCPKTLKRWCGCWKRNASLSIQPSAPSSPWRRSGGAASVECRPLASPEDFGYGVRRSALKLLPETVIKPTKGSHAQSKHDKHCGQAIGSLQHSAVSLRAAYSPLVS